MRAPFAADLARILRSAAAAPSAENRHHFVLEPYPEGVNVWADEEYALIQEPHRRVLTQIAFGAAMENMQLTAGAAGVGTQIEWFPEGPESKVIGRLIWKDETPSADTLADWIGSRHTNRRFYRRKSAPAGILEKLCSEARRYEGIHCYWMDGPSERQRILHLIKIAETERFQRQKLHAELFEAIRFDVGWRASCPTGLPPGSLEVEPGMRTLFTLLRHWPLMRSLSFLGMHWMLGLRAGYIPARLSPHLGLIAATGDRSTAPLRGGGALQRLWLRATAEGLALQPMAAATILPLMSATSGWVSEATKNELETGWRLLVGTNIYPIITFRLGYAAPPTIVAGREVVRVMPAA